MARIPGFFRSIQAKILIIPILMLLAFVLLINTYFLTSSRNITFSSKRSFLQSHGFIISSALSALDELSGDRVRQAMSLLEVNDVNAVIITDDKGETLYSSEDGDTEASESLYTAYVDQVQGGNDVFYSRFSDGAFFSCSSPPSCPEAPWRGSCTCLKTTRSRGPFCSRCTRRFCSFPSPSLWWPSPP
jgi:hypothetical protein